MPIIYENNSPAVRLLKRSNQLMSLHGQIAKQMLTDTEAEQRDVQNTVISRAMDEKKFVRETMARIEKSRGRFADVELWFQLIFCRHVDNFQIFLEELVSDAIRTDPSLVENIKLRKADDTLPAEERLERRLRKLAFMSLTELADTLRSEMRFELFESGAIAARLAFLYDVRNLITHRYGIVDQHFLKRYSDRGFVLGTMVPLKTDFIRDAFIDLSKAATDIQMRALNHFGLKYETKATGQVEWWEESDMKLPDLPRPSED